MADFVQGDSVEVSTGDESYAGIFIKEDKYFLVVKLKNGYNIGIARRRIKEASRTHEKAPAKAHKAAAKQKHNAKLPKISLLHTGGTIASKVDYATGAVSARFTPEEILGLFPELNDIAEIRSRLVSNMFSENIRFHNYNAMAKAIDEEVKNGCDAVILTHGTDTLHYTSAALGFMLENVPVPVVLIGSQRSSDRPSTDSAGNLIAAAVFAVNARTPGVFVCMHENLNDETCIVLDAMNCRKMHSSRRDAFRPVNRLPFARVDYLKKELEMLGNQARPSGEFNILLFDEKVKIGLVKAHPQMFASEIRAYAGFDGLVIEGTGLGHIGIDKTDEDAENESVRHALKELASKIPVAMTTQTIYGRVDMNVYATGRELLDLGIVGNYCDMTPETAFIKLAWLLSNHKKDGLKEIRRLYETDLRGEISDRSESQAFLF